MTAKILIQRKFRRRWSDLQLLVLLELGAGGEAFVGLVERTGGSTSGVWNALALLRGEGYVEASASAGRTLYSLTVAGRSELGKVLQ